MGDYDERAKLENKLKEVRSYLDSSALWFSDPAAQPGDWVQFEGEFGYSILETGRSGLFLMSQTPSTFEGDVALLIHGSPQNVLLRASRNVSVEELDSWVAHLRRIANELVELDGPLPDQGTIRVGGIVYESESAAIQLYERIAERHDGVIYVQGLAKVSMVVVDKPIFLHPSIDELIELSRLVVASPLYIQSLPHP
jgi:hypothetical protein